MEMSSITEPISVFDFRTGSGQKAQEPVIVEMSAQAPWMDPPGKTYQIILCNIVFPPKINMGQISKNTITFFSLF